MRVRVSLIKDNAKKNIKKVLAGDENKIARLAKKAYVGVDGIAKLFWGGSQEEQEPVFLNYIESTGTQYIDTGFKPNPQTTKVVAEIEFTNDTIITQAVFGARPTAGLDTNSCNIFWNLPEQAGSTYIPPVEKGSVRPDWVGKHENQYHVKVALNNKITITCENNTVSVGAKTIASYITKGANYLNYSMFIGNLNNVGSPFSQGVYAKWYSFKVYDNGVLVRDFKPCKDENGVICLYDLVEKKYYYNQGTGSFIGDSWEPTQLEYIENVDKQYIDTGFKPNQDTTVEIKMLGTKARAYWFGAWNETYKNGAYSISNDDYNLYFGYDGQYLSHSTIASDTEHIVKMDKNIAYIDGQIFKNFTYTAFQVNYNLYLFSQNRKGTAFFWEDGLGDTYKLSSCKIYDNGILVRDFVPALDQNNVAGLWDKVNRVFYYNQGTGTFNAGPVVV